MILDNDNDIKAKINETVEFRTSFDMYFDRLSKEIAQDIPDYIFSGIQSNKVRTVIQPHFMCHFLQSTKRRCKLSDMTPISMQYSTASFSVTDMKIAGEYSEDTNETLDKIREYLFDYFQELNKEYVIAFDGNITILNEKDLSGDSK